jgi:erythromycin esterase
MPSRTSVVVRALLAFALVALCTGNLPALQTVVQQSATDPLNLGFERAGTISTSPGRWYAGGQGYLITLDTASPHSGVRSLRMQAAATRPQGSFGVATANLPVSVAAGKTVRFRGYIRTEGITQGYAGLWMRVDSGSKILVLDNMAARGATGTTAWTPYEITLRADSSATAIYFGALFPGEGRAWFDSFTIDIDGTPYVGAPQWRASSAEVKWAKDHAIALTTSDPNAPLGDLRPVGDIVGDAHIVELGEGTHGTSEFFQMKHRLTKYLAESKGFTVFAIEASMPEARRVNEYVLTGRGDPKAALAGMYFWTWNTEEVLGLIEWMRRYNASGAGRMEFWGFDLQTPDVAMDSVRAFVGRADPAYAILLDSAYARIKDVLRERRSNTMSAAATSFWESEGDRVLTHLLTTRDSYVAAGRDSLEVAWAIQNARIVVQGARSTRSSTSRDSSMAVNVQWIAAHQPPGTKMVLWAHNGHVARQKNWMGAHLAARYGNAMRVIGFALGDGDFTAVGPRGLAAYPSAPPDPGTLEDVFRATGIPRFALDLRRAGDRPESAFLAASHDFRSIGAMATDSQFFPTHLANDFDVVIYFDHTTPSVRIQKPIQP